MNKEVDDERREAKGTTGGRWQGKNAARFGWIPLGMNMNMDGKVWMDMGGSFPGLR